MSSGSEGTPGEGGQATPATGQPWGGQGSGKGEGNAAYGAREGEGKKAGQGWSVIRRKGKRKGKRKGRPTEGGRGQGIEEEGREGQHQGAEGQHQVARETGNREAGLCGMMLVYRWTLQATAVREDGWEDVVRNCKCPGCSLREARGTACIREVFGGLGMSSLDARRACSCPLCWVWEGVSDREKISEAICMIRVVVKMWELLEPYSVAGKRSEAYSHWGVGALQWLGKTFALLADAQGSSSSSSQVEHGSAICRDGESLGSNDGERAFRMEVPGGTGHMGTWGVGDEGKVDRPSEWKSFNVQGSVGKGKFGSRTSEWKCPDSQGRGWEGTGNAGNAWPANRPPKGRCQNASVSREGNMGSWEASRPSEWKSYNAQGKCGVLRGKYFCRYCDTGKGPCWAVLGEACQGSPG